SHTGSSGIFEPRLTFTLIPAASFLRKRNCPVDLRFECFSRGTNTMMSHLRTPWHVALGIFLISSLATCDLIDKPPNGVGNSHHPEGTPVTPELIRSLKAPPGFSV